ncbi:hypothetical protein [Methylomonas rapida]|uniref:Nickel/cobalt transporter regulator n=1 Tax=Methylomonas rapida TaxID=2963939 RepID=A0ABY7GLG9_9GAMM|nr:hypothetical protein [Methylomonas rapida]WAR45361.1 hypothetical protein NM686_002295 [Methylomonas rapida]
MSSSQIPFFRRLVFLLAAALLALPALADKPEKGNSGKHKHKPHQERRYDDYRYDDKRKSRSHREQYQDRYLNERYFSDQHRVIVRDYYVEEYRRGRCPPGLAKKNNGCLPPGQAKRWVMGRPLPRDVIFYDLPDRVVRQIGYPPAGYRFVRVASDILLITVGAGLVVDAIADLNAMP